MPHENNKNKVIKFPQKRTIPHVSIDPYFPIRQLRKLLEKPPQMGTAELTGYQDGISKAIDILHNEISNQAPQPPKRGA